MKHLIGLVQKVICPTCSLAWLRFTCEAGGFSTADI